LRIYKAERSPYLLLGYRLPLAFLFATALPSLLQNLRALALFDFEKIRSDPSFSISCSFEEAVAVA
jgi:hypothetical protein